MNPTEQAVTEVLRASYSRLIAYLSVRSGDIAGAEDALSEAFYKALRLWPEQEIPDLPEAWLLRTAKNHQTDEARKRKVRADALPLLARAAEEARETLMRDIFPDERLKLLFICAHPAIDPAIHTPLMLQTVLGMDAARIASAFLVPPATMGQRLVRAKSKIRDAALEFRVPEEDELPPRLDAVLEAIYAVYGQGWEDITAAGFGQRGMVDEAFWLARLTARLLPDEPEPKGLLALMLLCEARRPARRSPQGDFVPLSAQNADFWIGPMIEEANELLTAAVSAGRLGRFQLEAAIQAAHCDRVRLGINNWPGIALLYEGVICLAPTLGAFVGRAAAVAEWQGASEGLALLDTLEPARVASYQPYWVLRAHLMEESGQTQEAHRAREIAVGLTEDAAVRRFLLAPRPTSVPRMEE